MMDQHGDMVQSFLDGKTLFSCARGAVEVVHGRGQEKGNMARSGEDVSVGRFSLNSFN